MSNRRFIYQPDLLFSLIRMPKRWQPTAIYDVPPSGKLISRVPVASFEEAHEDLVRCNQIALSKGLRYWAVIEMSQAEA